MQNRIFLYRCARRSTIQNPFTNKDLPELRARFLRDNIVDPMLRECAKADVHSFVLKGKAADETVDPSLRKVDLYLYAY